MIARQFASPAQSRRAALLAVVAGMLSACAGSSITPSTRELPWSETQQMVVVTTADWNATQGTLRAFERSQRGWSKVGDDVPVVIGRAGAAWGLGLHPQQPGPLKQEGDGRSPAGVFAIGTAFGYAPSESTPMPYAALDAGDYCIDVSGSPLYNRIVNVRDVGQDAVAASTEPMRRDLHAGGDPAYKLGFVIEHNARGSAGAGSCIFAHLWKSSESSTAGCTAMAERSLRTLVRWLQPRSHPLFVLLPRAEYGRLQAQWQLPDRGSP